jgi:Ca2+-binding RTX toxin-like protein
MLGKFALLAGIAVAASIVLVPSSPGSQAQELCFGATPTVTGSGEIAGTPGDDVIVASEGADRIRGFTGNDKICGGAGDDRIGGGPGNDEIDGGPGNDEIDSGAGSDRVLGGAGDDLLRCGTEDDVADGGEGTNIAITSGYETCEQVSSVTTGGGPVAATPKRFDMKLTVAQQVPRPQSVQRATAGRFTATFTPTATGGTLGWRLTYSRLTGRVNGAHVHLGNRGKAGPLLAKLCGPCPSGVRGTIVVDGQSVRQAIVTGGAYVDAHTSRNPNGEIRGQIPKVK